MGVATAPSLPAFQSIGALPDDLGCRQRRSANFQRKPLSVERFLLGIAFGYSAEGDGQRPGQFTKALALCSRLCESGRRSLGLQSALETIRGGLAAASNPKCR
jgi:hypothetical protein